jgi:hypothetical protein
MTRLNKIKMAGKIQILKIQILRRALPVPGLLPVHMFQGQWKEVTKVLTMIIRMSEAGAEVDMFAILVGSGAKNHQC